MEMRYFLGKWIPGDGAAMMETILILLIVGGWLRGLFVSTDGTRAGLFALLGFSLLAILIAAYDIQYFPIPWPEETRVVSSCVFSVIAVGALVFQLRRKKM